MSYKSDYTVVSNRVLLSTGVSLKAKGLYAILMTGIDIGDINKHNKNSWKKEWAELEEVGLIVNNERKLDVEKVVVHTPTKQKPEPLPKIPKEERRKEFYKKLTPYLKKGYSGEMLRKFYDYWTESNESPNSKLLFEKQGTWDLNLRLKRWKENGFDKEEIAKSINYQAPKNNYD